MNGNELCPPFMVDTYGVANLRDSSCIPLDHCHNRMETNEAECYAAINYSFSLAPLFFSLSFIFFFHFRHQFVRLSV